MLERLKMLKNFDTQFCIPATELHTINEYIEKELHFYENKIFSNEHGYLTKIVDIMENKFSKINYPGHDGSIVIDSVVKAEFINVNVDDIIQCEVWQNIDCVFSQLGPLCIIIRHNSDEIKCGDIVKVKVASKNVDVKSNVIKVVSDLVVKSENDKADNTSVKT